LFDGKLVNRFAMAKLLNCTPGLVSKMIKRKDGMPYIRMGARYWFSPENVLAWFQKQQQQDNPTRKARS